MSEPARTSWPAVILAVGAGVAAALQVGKAPIALPFIRAEINIGLSEASWILSIFALLGAIAGASMGSVVTRLGARRMLPLGLLVLAMASLAGGLLPNLPWLLASRAIEGVGYMLVAISAPALITLLTHHRDRQMAFGLWGCFMPFGTATAMMAAPGLPLIGWRGLWLTMAALLACYAVLIHRRMPHPAVPAAAPSGHLLRDIATTVKGPGPLLLSLLFVPYSASYAALTGFLPTLLIERMALSPGVAGMLTAVVAAVNIIGNISTGPLLRWGLPRWSAIAGACAVFALTSFAIFAPGMPSVLAYALCLIFSAVGGLLPGCVLGAAAIYAPERRLVPVTLGLLMQGSNLGQLMGPVAVGAAVVAFGWEGARLVLVPASVLGVALALVLRRMGKEP